MLQEKMHRVQPVYKSLLDTHLEAVIQHKHAFELIVRSFPADRERQSLFYARLVALVSKEQHSQLLAANGVLAHHICREVQRVVIQGELPSPDTALFER